MPGKIPLFYSPPWCYDRKPDVIKNKEGIVFDGKGTKRKNTVPWGAGAGHCGIGQQLWRGIDLYSGAGISAISSVPYAFSLAFPALTLGTWTYLFQGTLIASLMIMRRKWVWPYLFSFVVGFVFSELLDVHELWIDALPYTLPWRVVYFVVSYLLICFGIALSNRCGLPIVPTDLFPRELADITKVPYPRIKIGFDVTCLAITAGMTFFFLGRLEGLGIGTIAAAFTMGKGIGLVGDLLDKHFYFENYKTLRTAKNKQ